MISKKDAIAYALEAGGSLDEINRQAELYVRQVGSVPFTNMIRALNMMTWRNDVNDWTRLAAALTARGLARKR